MNEETIGFALLLLVAAASVFSVLFLQGGEATGQVSRQTMLSDEVLPIGDECVSISCPFGYPAEPVLDRWGRPMKNKDGSYGPGGVLCQCPVLPEQPQGTWNVQVP